MESASHYLERKGHEIALIARCLDPSVRLEQPLSVSRAIAAKLRLARELRAARALESWAIMETARPEAQCWRVGAYLFSFAYQRADLKVRGPAIYDLGRWAEAAHQATFYTVSGMSAIAALVAAMLRVHGEVEIAAPRGFYNETHELLATLAPRVSLVSTTCVERSMTAGKERTRVLLLDSSVNAGFRDYRRASQRVNMTLFDTTCFPQTSSRITAAAEWSLQLGIPVVLVRSHAKLDCLGIEYGRLGSIVLLWPRKQGGDAGMQALRQAIDDSVRLYGVAAIPAHFPPFAGTEEYRRCSRARAASIICSTRRMTERLSKMLPQGGVRRYAHGLYLALIPDRDLVLRDVKRLAGSLADALASKGLPVKHAGSFGFDFVAVEWFFDPCLRRNVIRVAGADLPASLVDRIIDGIAQWATVQPMGPRLRRLHRPLSTVTVGSEITEKAWNSPERRNPVGSPARPRRTIRHSKHRRARKSPSSAPASSG